MVGGVLDKRLIDRARSDVRSWYDILLTVKLNIDRSSLS